MKIQRSIQGAVALMMLGCSSAALAQATSVAVSVPEQRNTREQVAEEENTIIVE